MWSKKSLLIYFLKYRQLFICSGEIEFSKYGQGGALGLATYLRIGSNLEIWQVRKIGGRPQYFRMTYYTKILNVFWQHLDYQWCTMLFSNRVVLYIIWNLAGWYSKLVNMNKRYIRKHDFSKWLKVCRNTKKVFFTIDNASIVKKRRKKMFGLWKCRCATHSEVWMWRMHQCTFIEDSQLHNIRLLS